MKMVKVNNLEMPPGCYAYANGLFGGPTILEILVSLMQKLGRQDMADKLEKDVVEIGEVRETLKVLNDHTEGGYWVIDNKGNLFLFADDS